MASPRTLLALLLLCLPVVLQPHAAGVAVPCVPPVLACPPQTGLAWARDQPNLPTNRSAFSPSGSVLAMTVANASGGGWLVQALDASNGSLLWSQPVPAAGAVAADASRVYVSGHVHANGTVETRAFSLATGAPLWNASVAASGGGAFLFARTAWVGVVADAASGASFVTYGPGNGTLLASFGTGLQAVLGAAALANGSAVAFRGYDGVGNALHAYRADGTPLWTAALTWSTHLRAAGGAFAYDEYGFPSGARVAARNAFSGAVAWDVAVGGDVRALAASADGATLAATWWGPTGTTTLRSLNAGTGATRWTATAGQGYPDWLALSSNGGRVFLGERTYDAAADWESTRTWGFSGTGTPLWNATVENAVPADLTANPSGTLVAQLAFKLDGSAGHVRAYRGG